MVSTWRQNGAAIQKYTDASIANIDAIGAAVTARVNAAHAAEDARNASIQRQWDAQDRYSKSFQDYQLDQTVLRDTETGERATVSNQLGDALVRHNPDRFQYVPTQDLLRGIDF